MNKTIKLNNGVEMPTVGYGVFQIPEEQTKKVVTEALNDGYRLIDTAAGYLNEKAVGEAINNSSVKRDDIFLTTKLWVQDFDGDNPEKAIDGALKRLDQDYIDLLLIHQHLGDVYNAWRAMEKAVKAGKVRAVGVSNFQSYQVQDLMMHNEIKPAVNQIQINPLNPENDNVKWLQDNDIVPEAWGPMGQAQAGIFTNPILTKIAKDHGKTVGQVMLAWNLQRGVVVIPKSVHANRIKENFDVFDLTLTDDEMKQINGLDQHNSYFDGLLTPDTVKVLGNMKFDYQN
ncbi:aldo/keto reductase [Lactobacillus hamsteri]|uniref:2,5 diketo-d-gluconic acid-like reductase, nadp dependent, (Promiscuous) n=1 Tax=Lactobacillus hamsteri DSM 5661 = JCM 6256 TaxID=1423754 RepID=A0A0R1Y7T2_9LACO|nr:aldo/keto reductase [Lactobacillus hamsteri]KRM38496.1 2,5 diketo-d-gluconic acid-like reductase, nadp dependent, (promiscuous) [Lactobacillus hamsteri DSM 5661 = JCM 6256]